MSRTEAGGASPEAYGQPPAGGIRVARKAILTAMTPFLLDDRVEAFDEGPIRICRIARDLVIRPIHHALQRGNIADGAQYLIDVPEVLAKRDEVAPRLDDARVLSFVEHHRRAERGRLETP